MQIEKNIAAMPQSKMNEEGKTKLEFSKELGIPRSTLQGYLKGGQVPALGLDRGDRETSGYLSGAADLRAGIRGGIRAVQPGHAPGGAPAAASAGTGACAGGGRAAACSVPALGGMEPPGDVPSGSESGRTGGSYLSIYSL